jgi:hypothetical protein
LSLPLLFFPGARTRSVGEFILGFAILFLGLQFMKDAMPGIDEHSPLIEALTSISGNGFFRYLMFAGAGLLAQSRQSMMIPWKRITKARYQPKNRTILLRGGWTENIALFCTEENYSKAEELVLAMTTHLREN